ncbi:hypothetical protein EG328_000396 [Venturia inaequalis]|uniref:WD40 repeat-like protein n=1 Tax=Venturia inaequalis TaxID=5025 RepID=A0A8H3Z5B1_VENIN|nr:hypothetical protein EG328_000396 [Venturia inaequalis]
MSKTSPQKISSIATLFLDTPPSCIEFSHLHPSYFVIGTYFLKNPEEQKEDQKEQGESQERNPSNESPPEKKSQERSGTLILCHLHETQIKIIHTLKTAHAILDLHFAHQKPGDERIQTNTFWTANSTGSIAEYEILFSEGTEKARIERRALHQLYPKDVLVLSFCWHPEDGGVMSTTLSNGEVHVLRRGRGDRDGESVWMGSKQKISSHDLEAWTSCFSSTGEEVLFSGGDDAVVQYTNTPTEFQDEAEQQQEQQQDDGNAPLTPHKLPRKFHNAGITALLPLPPSLLLTGSYDDHIRLLRTTPRPSLLTELNLNGGVWRLKLLSSKSGNGKWAYDILASCMHAGTRIVRLEMDGFMGGGARFVVLASFEENESMNYGSDVQPRGRDGGEEEMGEYTVVSTSFYDKRVCLWRFWDRVEG